MLVGTNDGSVHTIEIGVVRGEEKVETPQL